MTRFLLLVLLGIGLSLPAIAAPPDTSLVDRRFERVLELNPDHPFVTRRLDAIRN